MSAIQVSRLLRTGLKTQFQAQFNSALSAACLEFGIADLTYTINWNQQSGSPQNFFEGANYLTYDTLLKQREPDLPALAMWVGEGGNRNIALPSMPRIFDGQVTAYWRFFLFVPGFRSTGLVDLREATEAAMLSTLNTQFTQFVYLGNVQWQALPELAISAYDLPDGDQTGWVQEVNYSATFEVTA